MHSCGSISKWAPWFPFLLFIGFFFSNNGVVRLNLCAHWLFYRIFAIFHTAYVPRLMQIKRNHIKLFVFAEIWTLGFLWFSPISLTVRLHPWVQVCYFIYLTIKYISNFESTKMEHKLWENWNPISKLFPTIQFWISLCGSISKWALKFHCGSGNH